MTSLRPADDMWRVRCRKCQRLTDSWTLKANGKGPKCYPHCPDSIIAAQLRIAQLETELSELRAAHSQALKDIEPLIEKLEDCDAHKMPVFAGNVIVLLEHARAVLHALTPPSNG